MKGKQGFFNKIFAYTFLGINILVCIWSAMCYMASIVSPARVENIGMLSLSTAFAFFANLFFVFFWLFTRKKWRSFIAVATLILCSKIFLPVFGWNFFTSGNIDNTPGAIKVMDWNVHAFGLYDTDADGKRQQMMNVIKENAPDILCMEEYNVMKNDSMAPYTKSIMAENGYTEYRFKADNKYEDNKNIYLGTAIFSKFPLKNFVAYPLDVRRRLIENGASYLLQADVLLPGNKTLRLFALHLYSSGITSNDINYIEELKGRKVNGKDAPDYDPDFVDELNRRDIKPDDHFKVFMFKLNLAYRKRALEADSVAKVVSSSPYPVLICGDFNDVPSSYTYTTVRGKYADAFVSKGKSLGRTFNEIMPTLRIDNIFYDP
ncbi:MAG: endonuclease/exonuclease/phosphatase family protein [Bacteroidetes bacterium]|nr:endonuclease/exonuclease/phosphatase family protein [Bacteroidota bacterium]